MSASRISRPSAAPASTLASSATRFRDRFARAPLAARSSARSPSIAAHIARSLAPTRSVSESRQDVIRFPFFVFARVEPLRLQIEHRLVAAALRHHLVVCPQLAHLAVLEHADAVRMTYRREPMTDQDGRHLPRRRQDAFEALRLAAE